MRTNLAMATFCRSPPDSLAPRSPTTVSNPNPCRPPASDPMAGCSNFLMVCSRLLSTIARCSCSSLALPSASFDLPQVQDESFDG